MPRKLLVISSLILIAIAAGALIWTRSATGNVSYPFDANNADIASSADAQAIREIILRARRIQIEAEYTFDTSQFDTVYINDPRGGEISDEALALIRELRQDPSIQKGQVGFLDSMQADIKNLRRLYEASMAELRAKEAAGTLTEEERLILQVDTYGWPTPAPVDENLALRATQTCEQWIATAQAYRESAAASATPVPDADVAYPKPEPKLEPITCPTSTPTPASLPFRVPYRSRPPEMIPPEVFEIDITSIEIEGDVARVVVNYRVAISEVVLVKVDGHWYIAGSKLLKMTL